MSKLDLQQTTAVSISSSRMSYTLSQLARELPLRSELHLARKLWHATTGMIIVSCYMLGMQQSTALAILIPLSILSLTLEVIRLKNPVFNEKAIRFFGKVIRAHEVHKVSGVPYFLASSVIAVAVFPRPVAVLSLTYLALGDPIASLFGVLYAKRSVKIFTGKSLHGTAAGFAVCALATWIFLKSTGMHGLDLIRMTLLGGFAGAFAELLPLELDDNFTIPVVSGVILWAGFIAISFM